MAAFPSLALPSPAAAELAIVRSKMIAAWQATGMTDLEGLHLGGMATSFRRVALLHANPNGRKYYLPLLYHSSSCAARGPTTGAHHLKWLLLS
jgi:hypothetical protein